MSEFILTGDNYYSAEADRKYMSVHQYLDFVGHMGVHGCEAHSMAKLNGQWEDETTTAMLVGSYVILILKVPFLNLSKNILMFSQKHQSKQEIRN